MRIDKISVDGLFGIFNHEIPLNIQERITIIHGANGVGKTMLLTMLNDFFHSRYSIFRKTPFEKFIIYFDNNTKLQIIKNNNDKKSNIQVNYYKNNESSEPFKPKRLENESDIGIPIEILDDIIPELERIDARRWLHMLTKEVLSLQDIIERYENLLPIKSDNEKPKWLKEILDNLKIYFIKSQRLFDMNPLFEENRTGIYRSSIYRSNIYRSSLMISTVSVYSKQLADKMQNKLKEYANISQSLDRTFPIRVVKQNSNNLTTPELKNKLDELEKIRNRLIKVGLLNKEEDSDVSIQPDYIDANTTNVLSIYVQDVEEKLNVFQDIADKIELFRDIINKKFDYSSKQIKFDKEKGFIFTTENHESIRAEDQELSPTDLSSGEQHEVIMLYDLLFNVESNSLVLIDEPELSLHVGWLVDFLKDLESIIKLADLDILMATHSPDLIDNRWDLTVELKK